MPAWRVDLPRDRQVQPAPNVPNRPLETALPGAWQLASEKRLLAYNFDAHGNFEYHLRVANALSSGDVKDRYRIVDDHTLELYCEGLSGRRVQARIQGNKLFLKDVGADWEEYRRLTP